MRRSTDQAFQRGYDEGFQAGYVQGRMAVKNERQAEEHAERQQRRAPLPHERPNDNGWVTVDDLLREEWELGDVREAYVIRDLGGDIVGVVATRG